MRFRHRSVFVVTAMVVLAAASGCETIRGLATGLQKPSASIRGVEVSALSLETATLNFDLDVTNPYSVPLPLVDVDYGLSSGGTPFVSGDSDLEGTIPAGGSRTLRVPATVVFSSLVQVVRGVRPGSTVPYTADLGISVDAPGVGPLTIPLQHTGEIPVPAMPSVILERVEWQRVGLDEAAALLKLHVTNTNAFAVDLAQLDYGLKLANRQIARASIPRQASFAAGGANIIDIPISFAPADMGLAFLDVLRGNGAAYDMSGRMKFSTPFGALDLPFRKSGDTTFVR